MRDAIAIRQPMPGPLPIQVGIFAPYMRERARTLPSQHRKKSKRRRRKMLERSSPPRALEPSRVEGCLLSIALGSPPREA